MNRETDRIHVFLESGPDNFFRGVMDAEIDNLDAGVTQRPRHDLHTAIMAIQSDLGDKHTQPFRRIACRPFTFCALTSHHASPDRVLEYWSSGVMTEIPVLTTLHYSVTPIFHSSNARRLPVLPVYSPENVADFSDGRFCPYRVEHRWHKKAIFFG